MSDSISYGGSALPRDAYHAQRMHWQANPPKRRPGQLTAQEAAHVLGVTVRAVMYRVAHGTLVALPRSPRAQAFFDERYIADVALAAEIKRGSRRR